MLRQLNKYGSQVVLKVNVNKTKLLRINTDISCNFQIDGETIKKENSFCYLESYVTKDGGTDADVTSRIQKARQSFNILNNV